MSGPAVLVMARAPRAGEVRPAVEPLLGAAGCALLEQELLEATVRWAAEVGEVFIAYEPADAGPEILRLPHVTSAVPQRGEGLAARVGEAAARVFRRHTGPLLIVWPELARLTPTHTRAALGDLEEGCDIVVGPTYDGNVYLLGIVRPLPALFEIPEEQWRGGRLLQALVGLTQGGEVELGMLRAERGLRRPADLRAALADPLLAPHLRATIPLISTS